MQGKIVVVAGPSGAGKTTIVKYLLEAYQPLTFSTSATTRPKRANEQEGQDYYFLTEKKFRERIREDAFVEFEEVYQGLFYGTLKQELQRIWDEDHVPILDIDVKGALNVKISMKGEGLYIFIHPGSIENLVQRLKNRGTESPESLQKRIARATDELEFAEEFQHVIYNMNLKASLAETEKILNDYLNLEKSES